jgi:hypothetical protein
MATPSAPSTTNFQHFRRVSPELSSLTDLPPPLAAKAKAELNEDPAKTAEKIEKLRAGKI